MGAYRVLAERWGTRWHYRVL